MAANKTQPTQASVDAHLATIDDPARRQDCQTLVRMMAALTSEPPVMWGPALIGFGCYHYRYDSGREGDFFLAGFAPRKGDLSIYLMADDGRQAELLARLGRHKMGQACLVVKRLADVDMAVLAQLIAGSVAELRRRHPATT